MNRQHTSQLNVHTVPGTHTQVSANLVFFVNNDVNAGVATTTTYAPQRIIRNQIQENAQVTVLNTPLAFEKAWLRCVQ